MMMTDIPRGFCAECAAEISDDHWPYRHSMGIDDFHSECCPSCAAGLPSDDVILARDPVGRFVLRDVRDLECDRPVSDPGGRS